LLTILLNTHGTIALVGALYWLSFGGRESWLTADGNSLIAAGALMPAMGAFLKAGMADYILERVPGAILMYNDSSRHSCRKEALVEALFPKVKIALWHYGELGYEWEKLLVFTPIFCCKVVSIPNIGVREGIPITSII
jgi:hypothetical protein